MSDEKKESLNITLSINSQQVENLKKIAREKAYEEDRDINYTDLIREAIDEYIINYAYISVDKKHKFSSEASSVLGITKKDMEDTVYRELDDGILNDLVNVVAKRDVDDILNFLHGSFYYSGDSEEIHSEEDSELEIPTVHGGKTLSDLVHEEEDSDFKNKLENLYERAYDSGVKKNDMEEIIRSVDSIKSKYVDTLSLEELTNNIKKELKDYIIYTYLEDGSHQGEFSHDTFKKFFQDNEVWSGMFMERNMSDLNKLIEKEKMVFKGEEKWKEYKNHDAESADAAEVTRVTGKSLVDEDENIDEGDKKDDVEIIIDNMLQDSQEDEGNEAKASKRGSVNQVFFLKKDLDENEKT